MASEADRAAYLDSSAIVKLIAQEPESNALALHVRETALVTSEVALAEVPRAITRLKSGRRRDEQRGLTRELERVLASLHLISLDRDILLLAGRFAEAWLRTLDAIHLASVVAFEEELSELISYDTHQVEAAAHADIRCVSPGA